jgi:hypothetical protein
MSVTSCTWSCFYVILNKLFFHCFKYSKHLPLKSDLLQGTETMHKTFIKTQLLTLCAAYNLKCKKNMKNHDIIQKFVFTRDNRREVMIFF